MAIISTRSELEAKFIVGILKSKGIQFIGSEQTEFIYVDRTQAVFVSPRHSTNIIKSSQWFEENPIKLEDLQTGMWVEVGEQLYQVHKLLGLFTNARASILMGGFNSDLTRKDRSPITRVFIPKDLRSVYTGENLNCIWERQSEVVLSLSEIAAKFNIPKGTNIIIR